MAKDEKTTITSAGDTTVNVTNTGMFAGCEITGKLSGTYIAVNNGPINTGKKSDKN